MLAYLDCLHKETGKNHFWRVAALYGDRVMPRIRSGRLIRRPRYAAYTEWPRYTETALCRVYGVAALYEDRVMPRIRSSSLILSVVAYTVGPHSWGALMAAYTRPLIAEHGRYLLSPLSF